MAISYSEALAKLATITMRLVCARLLNSLTRLETNHPGLPCCGQERRMGKIPSVKIWFPRWKETASEPWVPQRPGSFWKTSGY